jgi:transposase InsO family protein
VPRKIIVDNAKQFNCHIFKDFCHQMGVKAAFTSVYHPQSNGEVEKANTLILTAIKMILEDQPKGIWAEELPGEVWCHNTFVCRLTKFTPLSCCMEKSP